MDSEQAVEAVAKPRLGILISGRGSNMQAIVNAVARGELAADVAVVVSNRPGAAGLTHARQAGIETLVVDHRTFPDRAHFERALIEELKTRRVALVCLAGFMRVLTHLFLEAFPNRILNIHPSLLPAFPGVDAQRQALEHGVRVSGATVHFVTPALDGGPIVLQAAVPVLDGDTVDSLSARILVEEHRIYPEAVKLVLAGGWRIEGRRFVRREVQTAVAAPLT